MDQEIIGRVLKNAKTKAHMGPQTLKQWIIACKRPLERVRLGNFRLSQKGEDFLNGIIRFGR